MPFGSRFGRFGQWWKDRSVLERILIIVTLIAIILIIILLARPHHLAQLEETACTTPTCIGEAAFVLEHVDDKINPCDDFYQFSCGNFKEDEEEAISAEVVGEQLLLEIYNETIQEGEHKMVKAAKKLFQACMNEEQREKDELKVMKEVLKAAGGWPALEGTNWDEANFDWLKATYKLRDLGYFYKMFLDFRITTDPENSNITVLVVTSDARNARYYSFFNSNKVELMQQVLGMFGVKDVNNLFSELDAAHTFSQELLKYHHPYSMRYRDKEAFKKFTVEEYQQHFQNINLLELLNNIVGPAAQLTKDDTVLFPPPKSLTGWFNFISGTPKRTQANFMMWRLIHESIIYLTQQLKVGPRRFKTLEEFCSGVAEISYTISPIYVLATRRHVPFEKKKHLEEMLQNVKDELVNILNKIKWIDENDKQQLVENLKSIETIIAEPKNYLDDKVFDEMDVDMLETDKEDFLSLLAQFERNSESISFSGIKKPIQFSKQWYFTHRVYPVYEDYRNTLFVPAILTKKSVFNEKRPHYLNYGSMGYIVGSHLVHALYTLTSTNTDGWSSKTNQTILDKISCVEKELSNHELKQDKWTIKDVTYQTIAELISYSAYENWMKKNGEERNLISVTYTPKQLFWISLASTICKSKMFPHLLATSIRENKHFQNDFGCPVNLQRNPLYICEIL